ncbi:uncharacterized protein [Chelonus insularis]|uniref:uncharacterized protein n=1 Tax=Chelonus insularis TaxID=460826 RepID=UPI00158894CA|nr:uncharacterized protein LOC118067024 [Chelonus insularis]
MTYETSFWFSVFLSTVINNSFAQLPVPTKFTSVENQSVVSESNSDLNNNNHSISTINQNNIATSMPSTTKRNEWWPPSDQEITQTSPYSTEIKQQEPASYYISVQSPSLALPHYRSEAWSHYGYPEYVYPILPSGSMMTTKRKDAMTDVLTSRKRRELFQSIDIDHMTPEQQDIFNNDSKVRCIQRTICYENRLLSEDFGAGGIKIAKYLTRYVKNSLKHAPGWDRLIDDAGAAGLRGEDCNVLYRDCFIPVISKFHK